MNAYLRKEIRLLLPSFGIALVMALSVWLIPTEPDMGSNRWEWLILLPLLLCPASVVMTALDAFGREIGSNTFANLLAQPISRSRIWWTKTSQLALALVIVFGVWWTSFCLHLPKLFWSNPKDAHQTFVVSVMLVVTVYSGGLWTVLLLRQVGAAFWFTLIVPGALAMLTGYLTDRFGEASLVEHNIICVLVTYSFASFVWAWRLFLRAQDVQWTGGEIALPAWVKLPRMFVPSVKLAGRRPKLALFVKEFQLHQSQFIIAGFLAILRIAIIVARNAHGGLKQAWALDFVAEHYWALWMLMPMLVGCSAVAEERKLGTLEGQLCLPAKRRTQFIIKFGVAMTLAVFFGVAVPVLFEGERILPNLSGVIQSLGSFLDNFPAFRTFADTPALWLEPFLPALSVLPMLVIALVIVAIAFYASTLARNTLQAIGPAILGILIVWGLLLGAANIEAFVHYPIWRGLLIYLIGFPVLTAALTWLTYWNFKRVLVGWPVWRRNLVVFFSSLAFVIAATTALYQRAWELVMQLEPAHDLARLSPTDVTSMKNSGSRTSVQLADGRAWSARFFFNTGSIKDALLGNWTAPEMSGSGFLEGTNWSSVAYFARDVLALQGDGSLWVSERPENTQQVGHDEKPPKLVRYGNDSDWKNLVSRWTFAWALKNDGTLWRIGTNHFSGKNIWPGLRSFAPQRMGVDTDWAEIFPLNDRVVLRKTDGRVYVHPPNSTTPKETIKLDDQTAERAQNLEQQSWRGIVWTTSRRSGSFQVGVAEDGKFCVTSDFQLKNGRYETVWCNVQIGSETNWLAVAGHYSTAVTLKADGTLWVWDFPENPATDRNSPSATRLGSHSDWRAITPGFGCIMSLAADGSLWLWQFDVGHYSIDPLLRPTRKPQLVGNIFSKAE